MMNSAKTTGVVAALVVMAGGVGSARGQDLCLRYAGTTFGVDADRVATGDVNGDGLADLLWINNRDLGVVLSSGDRSFGATAYYSAPCCFVPIAVGDFNGDGLDDVAMASGNGGSNSFRVRFAVGDGSGALGNSLGFGASENRDAIASADFNGDGFDDVVVSGPHANEFAVYLGRSDNAFDTAATVPLLDGATRFEVADVDGDSDLDLVMPIRNKRRFQVSLNLGNGLFAPATEVVAGDFAPALTVGEFTGDGVPDVLAGDDDDLRWQLFRGDGAGGFVRIANLPVGLETNWMIATEISGGSETDLIAETGVGSNRNVQFYEGLGGGDFALIEEMGVPTLGIDTPALGDITGDGVMDIVLSTDSGAAVFPGRGTRPRLMPVIDVALDSATADFDGDGVLDLVVIGPSEMRVMLGLGDGTFGPPTVIGALSGFGAQCGTGDFNGDGVPDAVALNQSGLVFAINNGDGTFGAAQEIALPASGFSMDVGDVSGDGIDDVVAASWFSGNGEVMPVISDGLGGFTNGGTLTLGAQVWSVALGDISGDGVNDIVVGSRDLNAWAYFVNNGAGIFASPFVVGNADSSSTWVVDVADIDGNGYGDVVAAMRRFNQQGSNRNAVFYNETHGVFVESVLPGVGQTEDIVAQDIDGDGMVDVAMTFADSLAVYSNLGSRSFTEARKFFPGRTARALHIADINLDGLGDYLVGTGGAYSRLAVMTSMPECGSCVADFNGDETVNTQDVLAFLNAWNAGDSSADINGDGSVNTQDVLAFLNLWNAGC